MGKELKTSVGLCGVFASIVSHAMGTAICVPFTQLCTSLSPFLFFPFRISEIKIRSDVSLESPTCEDMELLQWDRICVPGLVGKWQV